LFSWQVPSPHSQEDTKKVTDWQIYKESKHGAIYDAEGYTWDWNKPSEDWTPGKDYRSPTCSVCHMSAINGVKATHDVTERLA